MAITLQDLSYEYGAHQVLDNIQLEIPESSITALVGRNGAGKSTLLRCIGGWSLPTKGDVLINDVSLRDDEKAYRKQIIFVSDTPDFYDELTAWEHVQFVAQLHRVTDWKDEAEELFDEFSLWGHRKAFPFTFSRGMSYKLALIMAFIVEPPVLVLDEPFGPLDANARIDLWQQILAYRDKDKSVFFSTHSIPEGDSADYIVYLQSSHAELLDAEGIDSLESLLSRE